jgi:hypothetical protein
VAGTDRSEGAVYKFSNVTPGVDCYIKLLKLNGGAQLISMETPGLGYADAWQPIIDGPGTPLGNKSWIDWAVSFRSSATGLNYPFPCLAICAIDVDGVGGNIGEFNESDGQTSYEVPFPSVLTMTDMGSGKMEAQGPTSNRVGIDTFALDVRINYFFDGKDSITLKIGQTVLGPGTGGATQRLNSIYFKKVTLTPFVILPVKNLPLEATVTNRGVDLKWQTDNEENNSRFEVEHSFDGIHFSTIGKVIYPVSTDGLNKRYAMMDKSDSLIGKDIAYYRIKKAEINAKYSYSKIVMVHLPGIKGNTMQAFPNPFNETINVNFYSLENGPAAIKIRNLSGETVYKLDVLINKGDNRIQIGSLGRLPAGMYEAQIIMNRTLADSQKIIKN